MTTTTEARVATDKGSSYLKQLCRHWGHKFPVSFDDSRGRIELPKAVCTLDASTTALAVHLEVFEDADVPRMQEVVAEHLQRFGFREELVFAWTAHAATAV